MADAPFHIGPAAFNMLSAVPLLDVVEQLIGPQLTSNLIQHVRLKPPAAKLNLGELRAHITATDWHQDCGVALEDADQTNMVTVWLAMTDATVENVCLQVQSQISGQTILPHCARNQTGIADDFLNESSAVPLPVKAGGAVFFHPLTPHASLTNIIGGFRWSFDIRFNVTDPPTGRSHFPDFVVRSRAYPETELSDWRACKAQWEEARARLAAVPHIDIHRWSADTPHCA
jgi:ectoine hydroxylase-related dioxygenase (phytanoyl-CoA dioxygenase family)